MVSLLTWSELVAHSLSAHGATVLDVSTQLPLFTPAPCGSYTFYLSHIENLISFP